MYIMYVDDSGVPDLNDSSPFYVISGVIIHESDMTNMKKKVDQFKDENFKSNYVNAEIHTHDIYKSRDVFDGITLEVKYDLLNKLYALINDLPIIVISVGIDKKRSKAEMPHWDVFKAAWTFLIERFDSFIDYNGNSINKGIIRIDKSCQVQEETTMKIINDLRKNGSYYQTIRHIVEEPQFLDSHKRRGLQLADATAYCTVRHLTQSTKFEPYWNIVEKKLRRSAGGQIHGYGLKIFP